MHKVYKNKNAPKEKNSTNCCLENTFFSVYKLHVLHKEHSTETAEGLKIWRGEGEGNK